MATTKRSTKAKSVTRITLSPRINANVNRWREETWFHLQQTNKPERSISLTSGDLKALIQKKNELKKAAHYVYKLEQQRALAGASRQEESSAGEEEEEEEVQIEEEDSILISDSEEDSEAEGVRHAKRSRTKSPGKIGGGKGKGKGGSSASRKFKRRQNSGGKSSDWF